MDVPAQSAQLVGKITEEFISPFLTTDMVAQLTENVIQLDNSDMLTFAELGVELSSMDRLAFDYLHRFRRGGHFTLAKGYH